MPTFWNFIVNENDVELRIDGDIVDDNSVWIYEWFGDPHTSPNKFRNELKLHSGKNITVWIDSFGGDTLAAAGIYNALKEHKGKVTCKIDGKAMSAASIIAMAADEIHMSPLAIMMIHNPWSWSSGDSKDMRHMADVLDEVKETIINAYQSKTGLSRKKISDMMDNETWMSAKTAVNEGFADEILYIDKYTPIENSAFMFSRVVIQNSSKLAFDKFYEMYNKKLKNKEQPTKNLKEGSFFMPAPAPELINIYQQKINNNLRRFTNEQK